MFWFRLAGHLKGGRTVAELQAVMSADEFLDWRAFYRLEPFGDEWRQTARIARSSAPQSWKKTDGTQWTEDDFMPAGCGSLPVTDPVDEEVMRMKLCKVFAGAHRKAK